MFQRREACYTNLTDTDNADGIVRKRGMVGMTESWRRVGPFLSPFSLKAVGGWDKGTYCYGHSTTVLQSFNG